MYIFSFFHQSHPGNSISIDLDSRQTGCMMIVGWYVWQHGIQEDFSPFILLNFQILSEDLKGVINDLRRDQPYECRFMTMRIWYQQNKSIEYEKGEKACLSCLGFFIRLMSPDENWEYHTVCVCTDCAVWKMAWVWIGVFPGNLNVKHILSFNNATNTVKNSSAPRCQKRWWKTKNIQHQVTLKERISSR